MQENKGINLKKGLIATAVIVLGSSAVGYHYFTQHVEDATAEAEAMATEKANHFSEFLISGYNQDFRDKASYSFNTKFDYWSGEMTFSDYRLVVVHPYKEGHSMTLVVPQAVLTGDCVKGECAIKSKGVELLVKYPEGKRISRGTEETEAIAKIAGSLDIDFSFKEQDKRAGVDGVIRSSNLGSMAYSLTLQTDKQGQAAELWSLPQIKEIPRWASDLLVGAKLDRLDLTYTEGGYLKDVIRDLVEPEGIKADRIFELWEQRKAHLNELHQLKIESGDAEKGSVDPEAQAFEEVIKLLKESGSISANYRSLVADRVPDLIKLYQEDYSELLKKFEVKHEAPTVQ
ncbi:hypothetical protein [Neptuniibacter sp. QD37_11]|uniref:hypothetical protein n=1 Tax=Neptuniibacter sp. QD37_11 TaxID=3398209 RepID=UPI0039F53BBC